ncbi:spore germination protein [Paenibacillus sp. NPDC058071]|uniref:spore germination protein n=1 Tax=Paenibacillus sp. NPDC058071 TaxID=3346326 RepID=UPI0036DDB268
MLKSLFSSSNNHNKRRPPYMEEQDTSDTSQSAILSGNFEADCSYFRELFDRSQDIVFNELLICGKYRGMIIFVDGFVDISLISRFVIEPLINKEQQFEQELNENAGHPDIQAVLQKSIVSTCTTKLEKAMNPIAAAVAAGESVLLLEGASRALIISMRVRESRAVEEAPSEPTVRGPREGFTEKLRTNTSMIRNRLKTTKLKMEPLTIGDISNTEVVLTYLEGVVKTELLDEVRTRLQRIKIDGVLESGYIEELIEDNNHSPFPQLLNTERPDRVAAALLEGKVGILIDNTPFALVLPATFLGLLQSPEDYYQRYMISTVTRWLRYWLALAALVFPSFYVAVITFHQEMVPANLLLSIASSREAVPFPAIIELFLMEITFEGLREAGIRMPRPVGQAVSIVGALVIGQAAVQAGIVSPILVIIVSFTGIASFIFPSYGLGISARLLRFPLMFLAGTLGLYGVFLGLLVICIHMLRLRSFGIPYLSPVSPLSLNNLKDTIVRVSWRSMIRRR